MIDIENSVGRTTSLAACATVAVAAGLLAWGPAVGNEPLFLGTLAAPMFGVLGDRGQNPRLVEHHDRIWFPAHVTTTAFEAGISAGVRLGAVSCFTQPSSL